MDANVSEGISASFQSCPSTSQSYDLQELFGFEFLSPSQSFPRLDINDLGLTPPPGSQLQQANGATQTPSLGDEYDAAPDRDPHLAGLIDGDLGTWDRSGQPDDARNRHGESQIGEQRPSFDTGDRDERLDQALPSRTTESADEAVQEATHQRGHLPLISKETIDVLDAFSSNSSLDTRFVIREIESAWESQKRQRNDGELDLCGPPGKRRAIELPQNHDTTSSEGTPSLSSPDSSHNNESDRPETSLPLPADRERSLTPDSLFDSTEFLFQEPTFSESASSRPSNYLDEHPSKLTDHISASTRDVPASEQPVIGGGFVGRDIISAGNTDGMSQPFPSFSNDTRERFSLDGQNILHNMDREVLKRVDHQPQYLSPYPRYQGPLGYLPSTPGIHLKYVEVADTAIHYRINVLKAKFRQASYERNKYKASLAEWMIRDPATGKSKEQLLQEENRLLRRVSSFRQKKADNLKGEVAEWKSKFDNLATTYNSLLSAFEYQRKMAHMAAAPAPVPNSALAPENQQSIPQQSAPHHASYNTQSTKTLRTQLPAMTTSQSPLCRPQRAPEVETTSGQQVTIDLTEEPDDENPSAQPTTPAVRTRERAELLQSMRNKSYNWLRSKKDNHYTMRNNNTSQSPSELQATPSSGGDATPQTLVDGEEDNKSHQTSNAVSHDHHTVGTALAEETTCLRPRDDDDELIRTMEEELARDSSLTGGDS